MFEYLYLCKRIFLNKYLKYENDGPGLCMLGKIFYFFMEQNLICLGKLFFLSTIKREKIGSSSFFKIGCVVVTLNLFPRLNMFDPYNLSEEQY